MENEMRWLAMTLALAVACSPAPAEDKHPQKITYEAKDGRVQIRLETPRWPGEPPDEWLGRHGSGWLAWEKRDGQALQDMDDRARSAEADADAGDGLRR